MLFLILVLILVFITFFVLFIFFTIFYNFGFPKKNKYFLNIINQNLEIIKLNSMNELIIPKKYCFGKINFFYFNFYFLYDWQQDRFCGTIPFFYKSYKLLTNIIANLKNGKTNKRLIRKSKLSKLK